MAAGRREKASCRAVGRRDSFGHVAAEEHAGLREALRGWRSRKASELGVPPYTLFWDRTLDELCARRPATPEELLTIWGFGEQKRRTFGDEILAIIASCPA